MPQVTGRIKIEDVKVNSVLAENVVTKDGVVIMYNNTVLSGKNLAKLKVNNIEEVCIEIQEAQDEEGGQQINMQQIMREGAIPVRNRPSFQAFEEAYAVNEAKVKDTLLSIGNGGVIDINELYTISDGVIETLELQSDIFTYLNYLKMKDDHTFSHSLNVSLLCNLIGKWIGLADDEIIELTVAGVLHDIGKTKIEDKILNKPARFTPEEFELMKRHTTYGYEMVKDRNINENIKLAVLMHHEKIDGSGYPLSITGDEINSFAKIVSICDIYDAMTANRVYRSKQCPFEVIKTFERRSFGELDTEYLLVFLKHIAHNYLGTTVLLSNKTVAEVVFINAHDLSNPIVRANDDFIDLSERKDLMIEQLV